jgi:hypothetical protein
MYNKDKHKDLLELLQNAKSKPVFYGISISNKKKTALPKPKTVEKVKPSIQVRPKLEKPLEKQIEKPLEKPVKQEFTLSNLPLPVIRFVRPDYTITSEYVSELDNMTGLLVYRPGQKIKRRKLKMTSLGLDVGTKTVVLAFRSGKSKIEYVAEINGYWNIDNPTPFVENMLSDANKVRSDGSTRPARYIKFNNKLVVLGRDAEELAYSMNDTLKRPMAEGGVTSDEEAMTVLASIIHGLLDTAENDIGTFGDNVKLCYCTTAKALNKESNIDYHERVIDMILSGYTGQKTESRLSVSKIKESHAIVNNMSPDGTGIGISWGAGTVTVSFVKYGMEIYSFCWVGSGDWIDEQVAQRHGYDPMRSSAKAKTSKETPTTVCKRKMSIDLTPGLEPKDRVGLDLVLHYDVLISNVINGISKGFIENEANARIDSGINVYMAGGTSSPVGFVERVKAKLEQQDLPFVVNQVLRHESPLYCVAEGCLKAAEMS